MKIQDIFIQVGRERNLAAQVGGSGLVGRIDNLPISVISIPYGYVRAVCLTIRVGQGNFDAFKKALKATKGLKTSMMKYFGKVGTVQYIIPYSFFMGKVQKNVLFTLDAIMPLVRAHFSAPPKTCEVCNRQETDNVVVEGGVPVVICSGCVENIRVKREAAQRVYEAQSPEYLKGIILGVVGAALGAIIWAVVLILSKSIVLIVSAFIGIGVAYLVKKGMGRVNKAGYVITAVLVLLSILTGEVFSYYWLILRSTGVANFSWAYDAFINTIKNNTRTTIMILIFALAGAFVGVAAISKMEAEAKGGKDV